MRSRGSIVLACLVLTCSAAIVAGERPSRLDVPKMLETQHVAGQVLVRFKTGIAGDAISAAHQAAGRTTTLRSFRIIPDLHLVEVQDVEQALNAYLGNAAVANAEPNYLGEYFVTPNDPDLGLQWAIDNINAEAAWDVWTGDPDFRIAILDMGFSCIHPDFAGNLYANPGEDLNQDGVAQQSEYNGIDDDNNGLVDDIHGYDFVFDTGDPCAIGFNHGSSISGIIGALTDNNEGIAGINWETDMVLLKTSPMIPVDNAIAGIEYVDEHGIRLANCSWGYQGGFSQELKDAFLAASDTLFVFAAGNSSIDLDDALDGYDIYPHDWKRDGELDNIIIVGNINEDDELSSSSNYGDQTVDLAAPGNAVHTTTGDSSYGAVGGTSFAAPHVTGVAGLLMSRFPELTHQQVRDQILQTVRPVAALENLIIAGGVVDAAATISIPPCGASDCGSCFPRPFGFCTAPLDTGTSLCLQDGEMISCDEGFTLHTRDCPCYYPALPGDPVPVCPKNYRQVLCR